MAELLELCASSIFSTHPSLFGPGAVTVCDEVDPNGVMVVVERVRSIAVNAPERK
jgi:hypothetical protein